MERTKNAPIRLGNNWFISNANATRPIQPLTERASEVRSAISRLTANGWTYVPAGIIWGWNVLTADAPFAEASPGSEEARKVIVMFTDSENTRRTTNVPRTSPDFGKTAIGTANADQEMEQACTNAKQDGIEIIVFWYQMRPSSADFVNRLKSCASKPDHFIEGNPRVRGDFAAQFAKITDIVSDRLRLTQ